MPRLWNISSRNRVLVAAFGVAMLIAYVARVEAQTPSSSEDLKKLAWSTDSTQPRRFVSVHGRRAAIFGYSQDGLEVWAYPVQIVSSYTVAFRESGVTTAIDGRTLLRRIVYSPESVTRIYAGPDFIVREKLFVPLDEAGAIIQYEVESPHPVDIEIRFIPVLDLMWPASIGGQEVSWSSDASAYRLSELTHRFTALIGSTDIVAHDETPNDRQRVQTLPGLAFTVRASGDHNIAHVIIAGSTPQQDAEATAKKLLDDSAALTFEKAAVDHYNDWLNRSLQIETPDAETNRALAWAEIALDQAWVCNPDLGCGEVAGYGPSRKARRPQYDWFFAGDGMVAVRALLASGQYSRAREELEFIFKYQDQKTGMIWHELTQSAGSLDWRQYPYMFVHVDLTFDFLNTLGNYYSVTGDRNFIATHWQSIQAAFDSCRSLLDSGDGLPRIPAGKEGGREQDPLSDELALSASWVEAARSFADLSSALGYVDESKRAAEQGQRASQAIEERYWDERQNFWITGYTRSGFPLEGRDVGPITLIEKPFLTQAQRDSVLEQLSRSDFQADWGTRTRASTTRTYDPNSYANGSVWALRTSDVASAFWAEHEPATALPIWTSLVPWSSLDSLGHMHETLAGDYYHEERESVPEQTWSSAGFLSAAVNGLLGLEVDAVTNSLIFAPHLPPNWDSIAVRNIQVRSSAISLRIVRSANEVQIQMQNDGAPVGFVFDPEIPLGANLLSTTLGNHAIPVKLERHPQDSHARAEFTLPHGTAALTIKYAGGISIVAGAPHPLIGDPSKAIKITGVNLDKQTYTLHLDCVPSAASTFELRTPWTIQNAKGATFEAISPGVYRFAVAPFQPSLGGANVYRQTEVSVIFSGRGFE